MRDYTPPPRLIEKTDCQKTNDLFLILSILFCICLIVSNILAIKLIPIFSFTATTGMLIIPISYIIGDTITEIWGYKKMQMLILLGFLMNFFVVIVFQIAIWLPAVPFWDNQTAFETILGNTPRITIASMLAFLIGSFINASIMNKMKIAQQGRNFSLRAIVSTIFGELGDSFIFFMLAFAFVIPFKEIFYIAMFQTIIKIIIEIIVLPITRIVVKKIRV